MNEPITAAAMADSGVRLGLPVRFAPAALRRLVPGSPIVGRAIPCRHSGSVDVFLEALEEAEPGAVLVIDNAGRLDEGCIGDLSVAEMRLAGVAGVVVWGLHRDTVELTRLGLPVWSLGSIPVGPRAVRAVPDHRLDRAIIGADVVVTRDDVVVADDDGVVFLPAENLDRIVAIAIEIVQTESRQAAEIAAGRSLRVQPGFPDYLERRRADPGYTFRRHLRERGGAIET